MSAYICGGDHFKALAAFCVDYHGGYGSRSMNVDPRYFVYDGGDRAMESKSPAEVASYYGDILYQENIRSVRARYPRDGWDDLPGPCVKPLHIVISEHELARFQRLKLSPVLILKMCDCLEYQSCETEDWRETLAHKLLDRIRKAAIRQLPGYDEAPGWDFDRAEYTQRRAGGAS